MDIAVDAGAEDVKDAGEDEEEGTELDEGGGSVGLGADEFGGGDVDAEGETVADGDCPPRLSRDTPSLRACACNCLTASWIAGEGFFNLLAFKSICAISFALMFAGFSFDEDELELESFPLAVDGFFCAEVPVLSEGFCAGGTKGVGDGFNAFVTDFPLSTVDFSDCEF